MHGKLQKAYGFCLLFLISLTVVRTRDKIKRAVENRAARHCAGRKKERTTKKAMGGEH